MNHLHILTAWALFTGAPPDAEVSRVVVDKSDRMLILYSGEVPIRRFEISLGDAPLGPKRRQGDERTPEGTYVIDWRNPDSGFHRSLRISYPNLRDRRHAERAGYQPGGDIFIHGLPNGLEFMQASYRDRDWTDGCIAVNDNAEMDEIWRLVPDGTQVVIRP